MQSAQEQLAFGSKFFRLKTCLAQMEQQVEPARGRRSQRLRSGVKEPQQEARKLEVKEW